MRWIAGGAALGLVACAAEVPEDTSESGTAGSPEVATGASAATATEAPAEDWPGYYVFDVAAGQDIHVSWGDGLLGGEGEPVRLPDATRSQKLYRFDDEVWPWVERREPDLALGTHVVGSTRVSYDNRDAEVLLLADWFRPEAANALGMQGGQEAVLIFLHPTAASTVTEVAL